MPSRRSFPLLWGSTASSNLADGITLAAAPLLAAGLTRDPALVSGIVVAQSLPWFLFGLFAGVIVDRNDRRTILVLGNAIRVAALGALAMSIVADAESLAVLYAAVFALGVAETLVDNASLAILPQLVSRERIDSANGRLFSTQSVLNDLTGPPLDSLLFSLSAVAAFATGSAAFLLAAVLPLFLPGVPHPSASAEPERLRAALSSGLRWFGGSRVLQVCSVVAATYNFTAFATMSILVLLAQDRLGLDEAGYGVLLAFGAAGGIPGGLLGPAIVRKIGPGTTLFFSNLLPALGYLATALATFAPVVAVSILLVAFSSTIGNVVQMGLRQRIVPNPLIGRVTSVYRLIGVGAAPLGGLAGGLLARSFGLTAPYWLSAGLMVLLAVAVAPYLTNARLRSLPPGD